MQIRLPQADTSKFDEASQQVGDTDLARRLTTLMSSLSDGTVVIFDGGWGVGKSTFVQRWRSQLVQIQIPSLYLDAFANDYLEDPFVVIAGAIAEAVGKAKGKSDPVYSRFVTAAARVGKSVAITAAKIGVKAATLGVINSADINEFANVGDALSDSLSDQVEHSIKDLIEQHEQRNNQIAALRKVLSELPNLFLKAGDAAAGMPLVVIIDELDRCRPDFALKMLETIKHFFQADGVHFILVCNADQLENSVRHRYGKTIAAEQYLRKFYDFRVDFVIDHSESHTSKVFQHVKRLNDHFLPHAPDSNDVQGYIWQIARAHKLSLRDVGNIYTNLALAYAVQSNNYKPAILVAILSTLKALHPRIYASAKVGELTYGEFHQSIIAGRSWGNFDIDRVSAIMQWHLDPNAILSDPKFSGFHQMLANYDLDRLKTIRFVANSVIDRFEVPNVRDISQAQ